MIDPPAPSSRSPRRSRAERPTVVLAANTSWYLFNFRATLAEALLARFRVVVFAPRDEYTRRLEDLGCEFHHVPFHQGGAHILRDAWTLGCFAWKYSRIRPDYVLNFTPKATTFSTIAAIPSGARVLNNISGLGRAFHGDGLSPIRLVSVVLYRLAGRVAAHTFYQNRRDLSFGVENGFSPAARSSLLPGSGVGLRRFAPAVLPKGETVHFLHVARLMREKGTFDFLEAGLALRDELGPERVRLTVAGPDSALGHQERSRFQELVQQTETEYLGMVDNVHELLRDVHCVVLPSTYAEGVPRSLIEAASSGKVLVCHPNPGSEEIVQDGVNGLVTRAPTAHAVADAMRRVIQMSGAEYLRMAEAGVAIARTRFDERIVIDAYMRQLEAGT